LRESKREPLGFREALSAVYIPISSDIYMRFQFFVNRYIQDKMRLRVIP